jgi:cytosine/adenosine deaminase-related metal-dependent hydrolase
MTNDEFTLTARWVFPVTAVPLERGLVTVRGDRIAAVEPHGTRTADVDLGDVAILPGFVNAHTHLDLTGSRGKTPPTPDFVSWLRQVIAFRRQRSPDETAADIATGVTECLQAGTTLVGDIAAAGASWDELAYAPLRAVIFHELLGLPEARARRAWSDALAWTPAATPTCRRGLSPHAPYSAHGLLFGGALLSGLPSAMHLAESQAELELLRSHSGPFVAFLQELGVWDAAGLIESPETILRWKVDSQPKLYVHCNYFSQGVPFLPKHSVIYCPRTHAAFGHAPHPFREFLARGVRVALGTDSLASNPDLSVLAEARFLHTRYADFAGDVLLRLATLNGAEALGWADETGWLDVGKSADFAVVALPKRDAADPHELLFESDLPAVATWFRGCQVYPQSR